MDDDSGLAAYNAEFHYNKYKNIYTREILTYIFCISYFPVASSYRLHSLLFLRL